MTLPRILIITPFRNEEHSIPHYLGAMHNLDYPPELIDVYWLENDSSDNTLTLLREAEQDYNFNSLTLDPVMILGPVEKKPSGEYWKDIPSGRLRVQPWLTIWNDCFLPFIVKSKADYVMPWYADALAPPDVITEFLKVFGSYSDAGWVGGALYRRHPRQGELDAPRPCELAYSKKAVRVDYTAHIWMMPRIPLTKCVFGYVAAEMHLSLIADLAKQGLHVYYQPSVFIKHVSTDGKIYDHSLGDSP